MNLKEELLEGYNQYCDEQVEQYIAEQFSIYLKSEGIELTEELLQEGKILNKIRWKLAKFSLRFLTEKSLNEFLMSYYSDKDGNYTQKSYEWLNKSKKEKVKKIRELADNLDMDDKNKIINNEAAKKLERSAVVSGVIGAVGIGGAAVANKMHGNVDNTHNDLESSRDKNIDVDYDIGVKDVDQYGEFRTSINGKNDKFSTPYTLGNKVNVNRSIDSSEIDVKVTNQGGYNWTKYDEGSAKVSAKLSDKFAGAVNVASSLLGTLASILFGAMWGSLIIGGISVARGARKAHKANVVRREDILKTLKSKRDLKEEYIHHLITKAKRI